MRSLLFLFIAGLALIAALHLWGPGPFVSPEVQVARALWQSGQVEAARQSAAAALPALRREVEGLPGDLERRMALAEALVLSGQRERGLLEARHAVAADLAPWVTRRHHDAVYPSPLETLAVVAAEAGASAEEAAVRRELMAHAAAGAAQPVR
jgi:hypothetical protein